MRLEATMSETRWTPGPWARHQYFSEYIVPADEARRSVGSAVDPGHDAQYARILCSVTSQEPFDGCERYSRRLIRGTEEVKANTALIAAAPDLYAALQVARDWIYNGEARIGWDMDRLDAALAKARGEQP